MFDGGGVRVTRRDGFRWVLAIIFIGQIIVTHSLSQRLQDNLNLSSSLKAAKVTDQPRKGEYVYLSGEVVTDNPRVDDPAFEQDFCRRLRLKDPITFEARFTHSVKRGKNTHTVTDRVISGSRDFSVRTPAGQARLTQGADRIYSHHSARIDPRSGFSGYSPVSTSLRVSYFAPDRLHLLGVASTESKGEVRLSGGIGKPLIVSEVSRDQLLSNTRLAMILTGAAIVYFLTTLFIPWKQSLREQIERMPSVCYIFDMTGGPEAIAIALFVLYIIGGTVAYNTLGGDHQFRTDQLAAVLFMGFCMLVHVGRSVEYFYVADKRDGFLYEYSRGLFSLSRTRLAPIANMRLWIDITRNSKGQKSYHLKATAQGGKVFDIGGSGSSEATLQEIKNEFEAFRNNKSDPKRMSLLAREA